MHRIITAKTLGAWALTTGLALALPSAGAAQQGRPLPASSNEDGATISQALDEMRQQLRATVEELQLLRQEVARLRADLSEGAAGVASPATATLAVDPGRPGPMSRTGGPQTQTAPPGEPDPVSRLQEEQDLQRRMLETLYQSKVESGSRYRVRLSGMALFNAFATSAGGGNNFDVPERAGRFGSGRSGPSFGSTMRQSLIGLDVSGPTLAGARTSGELLFDFFGGFPKVANGVTTGLPRLRTAAMRMEWPATTVVFGQTEPFISPLSPSSLASVAIPALAYSGNLWAWVPQVSIEHRVRTGDEGRLTVTGGLLDPLTGDDPVSGTYFVPGAGHRGGWPAVATRFGWESADSDRAVRVGVGGYYARQDWGPHRIVNGWVTTADWVIPLGRRVDLSGEFYTGQALGGLGAGENGSVLFDGDPRQPSTNIVGLRSTGGWVQGSLALTNRLDLNAAWGQDSPSETDLVSFPVSQTAGFGPIGRNRTGLVNVLLRARSNLLFSGEFRSIWTSRPGGARRREQHVNFAAGVLF